MVFKIIFCSLFSALIFYSACTMTTSYICYYENDHKDLEKIIYPLTIALDVNLANEVCMNDIGKKCYCNLISDSSREELLPDYETLASVYEIQYNSLNDSPDKEDTILGNLCFTGFDRITNYEFPSQISFVFFENLEPKGFRVIDLVDGYSYSGFTCFNFNLTDMFDIVSSFNKYESIPYSSTHEGITFKIFGLSVIHFAYGELIGANDRFENSIGIILENEDTN